jgi:hypothetical protein
MMTVEPEESGEGALGPSLERKEGYEKFKTEVANCQVNLQQLFKSYCPRYRVA